MKLKLTTWNIEHLGKALASPGTTHSRRRLELIADEIRTIEPHILAIQEGPKGEDTMRTFASEVLERFLEPVVLPGNIPPGKQPAAYRIQGSQWMWFLVRPQIRDKVRLQSPIVYQSFAAQSKWRVHYWGKFQSEEHAHFRHPQVMILTWNGVDIEFINVHLKSKINQLPLNLKTDGTPSDDYVDEALKARIKMATEAADVRRYINAKFAQKPNPGVVVLGDFNDGPGKDYFEEFYLFFDLIVNVIQGDILSAEEFLNHSLFDFKTSLRWTARFDDQVTGKKAEENRLLLDHILFSQPLVNGSLPLQINTHAGLVEHEIHERINANSTKHTQSSDHRPVSCYFDMTSG